MQALNLPKGAAVAPTLRSLSPGRQNHPSVPRTLCFLRAGAWGWACPGRAAPPPHPLLTAILAVAGQEGVRGAEGTAAPRSLSHFWCLGKVILLEGRHALGPSTLINLERELWARNSLIPVLCGLDPRPQTRQATHCRGSYCPWGHERAPQRRTGPDGCSDLPADPECPLACQEEPRAGKAQCGGGPGQTRRG